LIEKGVVCWSHVFRGLLLARPIRMFGLALAVVVIAVPTSSSGQVQEWL
jgi:hypothetical protein